MIKKSSRWDPQAPVVIGGVGGSGTRVVAEILLGMDFYLGQCRPETLDNEWFAQQFFLPHPDLLLNRPEPFREAMLKALPFFERYMISEQEGYFKRALDRLRYLNFLHRKWYPTHIPFITKRDIVADQDRFIRETFLLRKRLHSARGWGWKEPISWFYLDHLSDYFSRMRYVHVLRNGYDMIYSENQLQFQYWRRMLCAAISPDPLFRPRDILNFWIKANQRALSMCERRLKGRFLVLKFEELCKNPVQEVARIADFLCVTLSPGKIQDLSLLVKPRLSLNRYKAEDRTLIPDEMIRQVADLGYPFEEAPKG
jgi:hypothetical protein